MICAVYKNSIRLLKTFHAYTALEPSMEPRKMCLPSFLYFHQFQPRFISARRDSGGEGFVDDERADDKHEDSSSLKNGDGVEEVVYVA